MDSKGSCLVFLLLNYIAASIDGSYAPQQQEICAGLDITGDRRLNRGEFNGIWYSQYYLNPTRSDILMNPFFFFQDEGKTEWIVGRDPKTSKCKSLRFLSLQQQTSALGPFSPCYNPRQTLPVEEADDVPGVDSLHTLLGDLAIFYSCANPRRDGSCAKPSVRIVSRSLDFTKDDIRVVQKELRRFNLSLRDLRRQRPQSNPCGRPDTLPDRRSRPHRRY